VKQKEDSSCLRYEAVFDKWSRGEELTDEEAVFLFDHQKHCALGIHTLEATEREFGLPRGALTDWNGRDPLPPANHKSIAPLKRLMKHLQKNGA
jgi:hypothetical protein